MHAAPVALSSGSVDRVSRPINSMGVSEMSFRKLSGALSPMRTVWRICQRYNEARYRRASKAAASFKARAEKFFQMIKGAAQ